MVAEVGRAGGKGAPRRKMKGSRPSNKSDNFRLHANKIKVLNLQELPSVEEVYMFTATGEVIEFTKPKSIFVSF